jgi:hypothetical protein
MAPSSHPEIANVIIPGKFPSRVQRPGIAAQGFIGLEVLREQETTTKIFYIS